MKYFHYYPRALVGNGGPTVAVWEWVRALKASDREVAVIYDADLTGDQPLRVPGVEVIPVKHRYSGRWRVPVRIADHLTPESILILHSAFLAGNLVASLAVRRRGISSVFVPHGAYARNARRRNSLAKAAWLTVESRVVDRALAVHAFLEAEKGSIRDVVPRANIIVAPTPVDVPTDSAWVGGGGYVAWFGRYDIEHKGLDLIVEAYKLIPPERRMPLRLRGRDSTNSRTQVAEMVASAGLSEWISVGGPVKAREKAGFLGSAELFLMPSRWEAFSIALLEALALGVPCIVSKDMPIAEELNSAKGAWLTSTDPRDIAEKLLQATESWGALADRVFPRRFVEEHLGRRAVGERFAAQVERLVAMR